LLVPRRSPLNQVGATPVRRAGGNPLRYDCEADVLAGLERFAYAEIDQRLGRRARLDSAARPGTLGFSYTGSLADLRALRSVIAVYQVNSFAVPRPKALLGNQQLAELVDAIESVRGLAPPGAYATLRLSAAGEDSAVLNRLKSELAERLGLAVAADEGDLLLRLRRARRNLGQSQRGNQAGQGWEVLIRITPRPLATRAWRVCNLPGSLNATLAYAMIDLTEPAPDDVLLNIGCGSGTLLIERLMSRQARHVIGCDTDRAALECAQVNLRAAGYQRNVQLEQWDAGALPLPDSSVSVICADLPFGQLVGSHRENEQLYPRIFAEAARVARPGARMVLLSHEVRLLERMAARFGHEWQPREVLRVRSGGMTPQVMLFRRTSS
jgi:ubiquinone/menaquinone biosynthesis C-methylase UbiE